MVLLEEQGPLGPLLPAHLSELVIGVVLFIVIVLVMRKVVVPRFEKMYDERADAIRGGMERADKAQADAAAALAQYQQQLAGINDEAAQIRDKAKQSGVQIQAEARVKAEDEAQRIVANARTQVAAERSQAVESLRKDVGSMATVLAGKILGESLSDDTRVKKTVDSFIDSLDSEPVKK
ncbi:MAG: F0F1 ATP synthase subunit B [Propionibacteriaceae bacterium]|jgi:F-type H+-transporting ATPase subunit b|nr:F0F1 ATP synthase subunit B [Propionibacteriaceae bacterium]